jgi:hypothetical protein
MIISPVNGGDTELGLFSALALRFSGFLKESLNRQRAIRHGISKAGRAECPALWWPRVRPNGGRGPSLFRQVYSWSACDLRSPEFSPLAGLRTKKVKKMSLLFLGKKFTYDFARAWSWAHAEWASLTKRRQAEACSRD